MKTLKVAHSKTFSSSLSESVSFFYVFIISFSLCVWPDFWFQLIYKRCKTLGCSFRHHIDIEMLRIVSTREFIFYCSLSTDKTSFDNVERKTQFSEVIYSDREIYQELRHPIWWKSWILCEMYSLLVLFSFCIATSE